MKHYFLFIAALATALILSLSCSGEEEEVPNYDDLDILVMPRSLQIDRKGSSCSFTIRSLADWTAEASGWIRLDKTSGSGSDAKVTVNVTVDANPGAAREGQIKIMVKGQQKAKITVTQDSATSLKGKKYLVIANSMVYYGGFVQYGSQGGEDIGMLHRILKASDMEGTVIDCTWGNHRLTDFLVDGCKTTTSHGDHLAKVDLASVDYVFLCAEGSNPSSFLTTCRALYKRVTDLNPDAKKYYINHVYTVFNKHSNILNNLKTLHETDGVTIINCGQLAYDIYTGAVKVPGGSKVYKDRYTFVNHTSSDTHHPNPLMGYIMTQMAFCALSGEDPYYADYLNLIKSCKYSSTGQLAYDSYYSKFYTTPATLPFMDVIDDPVEMKGIQQLIPQYINKY